jgi:hypothetical protein
MGGAPEELSEDAKARFNANAASLQQIKREEKKSRKKDDQVAKTIKQFLSDDQYSHLFVLISRLVARDCPSIFILAILSLIHEGSKTTVQEYLKEMNVKTAEETVDETMALTKTGQLDETTNRALIDWITRMQMVLSLSPEKILLKLMIDDKNIDGTVLQLTTFILQDFFAMHSKKPPFEKIQPLTASILQTVFEPFIGAVRQLLLEKAKEMEGEEGDDEEM